MAEHTVTVRGLMAHVKGIDQLLPQEVLSIKIGEGKQDRAYPAIKKFFTDAIANKKDVAELETFLKSVSSGIDKRLKR